MKTMPHRLHPTGRGVQPEPIATTYWERLDQKLQIVLKGAPAYSSKAPDANHLRLLVRTIDELRSQVELESLTPD